MLKLRSRLLSFQLFVVLILLSGCATTQDSRVSLLYEPTGTARGGFGEIVLYTPESNKETAGKSPAQWELGRISDKEGKTIAKIISSRSPNDLIIDAFTQELKSSGYSPVSIGRNPSFEAEKGVRILDVSIKIDEIKRFLSDEATSVATLTVQPLRNGNELKKLRYESRITFSRVSDRDQIANDVLHKTLQNLMQKAMPDIVKLIEQK